MIIIITLLTCLILTSCTDRNSELERPNILFILVDDLNDWIEPLGGNNQAITPNMSKLADEGMVFTNAHTSSPACHPSRVALMTGVHSAKSGIVKNVFNYKNVASWRESPLLKNATTISQHFRNNGYTAICGGKIYHTLQGNKSDENDYSTWDEVMPGDPESGSPIAFQPRSKSFNVDFETEKGLCPNRIMSWGPINESIDTMADDKLVDWAINKLNEERKEPFFLAVGIFRPHLPWEVPQEFFDIYPLENIKVPDIDIPNELEDCADHHRRHWHRWVKDNEIWDTGVQAYLASISFADYEVGRLIDGLKKSGKDKNTIIVLWSDHGMHIGEKENWEKFTLFEEATRIPIMIIDPRENPGSSDTPISSVDIFPTLVELTNTELDKPDQLDGVSAAEIVRGGNKKLNPVISTFESTHAVRTQNYRYIFSEDQQIEELYDHSVDPEEHTNIAYHKNKRNVLQEHRGYLTKSTGIKTPSAFSIPDGFEQLENENIRRVDYKQLHEITYIIPDWWTDEEKEAAKERMKTIK